MATPKHDYYETLGVPRKRFDAEEIRKAYRKLARKYHPDLNPGDKASEERFKERPGNAYDVLSDSKKRPMYDQFGFYSENGFAGGAPPPPGGGGGQRNSHFDFSGFDFSDFGSGGGAAGSGARRPESSSGGGFRDIFSQFFGGHSGEAAQQPEAEKGGDLEYVMNIDFWQAIKGTQTRVNITRYDVCETCHGSGSAGGGEATCQQCKGTGHVSQMAGAMKFNLTCPRCGGSGKLRNGCPGCGGEGRVTHTESVENPDSTRGAGRIAPESPGQGQRRFDGRSGRRSLHHHKSRTARLLPARGGQYPKSRCRFRFGKPHSVPRLKFRRWTGEPC